MIRRFISIRNNAKPCSRSTLHGAIRQYRRKNRGNRKISVLPIRGMPTGSSTPGHIHGISTRHRYFYLVENDHITHRVIHVQSSRRLPARLGDACALTRISIEAIALGHDIGHIPYGHFGESCLSDLCKKHDIGKFFHNVQSVRFSDRIEDPGT